MLLFFVSDPRPLCLALLVYEYESHVPVFDPPSPAVGVSVSISPQTLEEQITRYFNDITDYPDETLGKQATLCGDVACCCAAVRSK